MKKNLGLFCVSFSFIALLMGACSGEYQSARNGEKPDSLQNSTDPDLGNEGDSVIIGLASTDEIEVQQMESFPVQVRVVVRGNLPNGCTRLDSARTRLEGDNFLVILRTRRPSQAVCTQALVPYEKIIPLDVTGLKAGTFSVNVNGTVKSFNLMTDNQLKIEE